MPKIRRVSVVRNIGKGRHRVIVKFIERNGNDRERKNIISSSAKKKGKQRIVNHQSFIAHSHGGNLNKKGKRSMLKNLVTQTRFGLISKFKYESSEGSTLGSPRRHR